MILSDADILRRLEEGDLVVDPLSDPEIQIQPASVDLRLGSEFLEFQHANIPCIHPNDENETSEYIEETTVPEGDDYILHPGDFVLGTTKERVEIPDDLIAHVEGRSSLGRLAIVVHASLPADEEVFLWTPEDGFGFHEIGEVVENEPEARAVSFDPKTLRVSTHRVTNYITNPTQRIYRVTLESGREVLVTKDHNLFTLDEHGGVTRIPSEAAEGTHVMVPGTMPEPPGTTDELDLISMFSDSDEIVGYATDGFDEIRGTDDIATASRRHHESRNSAPLSSLPVAYTPDTTEVAFKQSEYRLPRYLDVTPEFGWILGFYIAEGRGRRKQLQFGTTNEAHLRRVAAWFEEFDASLSRQERDDGCTVLTVCSALWSKIFRRLAGEGDEKNIPQQAWNWEDTVLEGLLDGLLDGDGHRRAGRDTLYTGNSELANRVQYLATRLGYAVSTSDRERETCEGPSDTTNRSAEWAVDISESAHKKGQYVPVPSALLESLRSESELTMEEAAAAIGYASKSSISNIENREYKTIKRDTLRRFRDAYTDAGADTRRLDQILDTQVRFERVISVEETDRIEPTYDLEVQPNGELIENFLGGRGGVFLSNTAGLCDPGYRGQITLELSNLGRAPVALTPGMRISQLTFTELKTPAERPYGSERGSKYQDQDGPQASRIQGDEEFGGDQV